MTSQAKKLIEKHANQYLDAEEAAHKRDREGLKSALDKHEELKQKAEKRKEGKDSPKAVPESEFDDVSKYGDDDKTDEEDNPVAEVET